MGSPGKSEENGLSQLLEGIAALPAILKTLKEQQQQIAALEREFSSRPAYS